MMVVPGGGANGCDCTDPGGGTPCPGSGRLGAGRMRPCGSSGTSSSSSCCWIWPRGTLPGGRGAGSENRLPSCARRRGGCERRGGDQGRKPGQGNGSKHPVP